MTREADRKRPGQKISRDIAILSPLIAYVKLCGYRGVSGFSLAEIASLRLYTRGIIKVDLCYHREAAESVDSPGPD